MILPWNFYNTTSRVNTYNCFKILSMIEEAAGTRMYESKKQSAQRTIEKKDSKLQEIETVRKVNIIIDTYGMFEVLSREAVWITFCLMFLTDSC